MSSTNIDEKCPACGIALDEVVLGSSQSNSCVECLSKAVDRQIEIALNDDSDEDEFHSCSEEEEQTITYDRTAFGHNLPETSVGENKYSVLPEVDNNLSVPSYGGVSNKATPLNEENSVSVPPNAKQSNISAPSSVDYSNISALPGVEGSNLPGLPDCPAVPSGVVLEDGSPNTQSGEQESEDGCIDTQNEYCASESDNDDNAASGGQLENDDDEKIEDVEVEEKSEDDILKDLEANMTDEEKESRKQEATELKQEANVLFRNAQYAEAREVYSQALQISPLCFPRERAILYANRGACKMKMDENDEAIKDCTKAVELHPQYLKAVLRRAELYEKTEKLEEALKDYETVLELDPGVHSARAACMRLPDQIKEKNEKLKEEMFSKLKDLGNMVLKPFGLSTNNFQLQQDPNTGGYSVQFQQNQQ